MTRENRATDGCRHVSAVLLAAGLGTRLRPLTDHVPKCLDRSRDRDTHRVRVSGKRRNLRSHASARDGDEVFLDPMAEAFYEIAKAAGATF